MEDQDAVAGVSKPKTSPALGAGMAGLVAVLVLGMGVILGALNAANQISDGVFVMTMAGLAVFVVAGLIFYQSVGRPLTTLSVAVRHLANDLPASPAPAPGAPEAAGLGRGLSRLVAGARAGLARQSALAAIVESSSDAMIGKTLDGIITDWNAAAEEQYGYRAGEAIGSSMMLIVPPGRAGELTAILGRVRRGEGVRNMATRRRRKDGTLVDVSLSVSPIRDADGAVVGAASVARDITVATRLAVGQRALDHQLERAARLESVGQIAGGIAHDFNNLLAVILSYAGFASQASAHDAAVQADLNQITDAAERAARITRQLLIAGRRETGHLEPMDPGTVIAEARDLLATAAGPGVALRVQSRPGLPAIKADRGQLEQALVNLAVNAREAMPGGGSLTFGVRAAEFGERQARARAAPNPGRYAELVVTDTGHGMSEEIAERAFEPFFTTKPMGEGAGLGLATVQSIVTGMGGGVTVESRQGAGATFRLLFPAAPGDGTARQGRRPGDGERTILVVDDEPQVLALTARILRQDGYLALEAGTCEEALSLAASHDPHLLVTDWVMPGISGPALAGRVRELKPGIPVLFMSGYQAGPVPEGDGPDRGSFIQKPFAPQALLDRVDSLVTAAHA
jgi:PAS domain S-box-containing protein